MSKQEGVTSAQVEQYSKNEIVKRCIEDVRDRADH